MSDISQKKFNLPWHQRQHYWLMLYAKNTSFSVELLSTLEAIGLKPLDDLTASGQQALGIQTDRDWAAVWAAVYKALSDVNAKGNVDVVLSHGRDRPDESMVRRQDVASIQAISDSMWLGDALLEGRVVCYLQPVLSAPDKVFGYESFARVLADDGSGNVIAGGKIVTASKALGIEYAMDRHLQVQAIKTFVSSEFNGYLFINFFPGFIHRPSVYLDGLAETVKAFGVLPKQIVLDLTNAELDHDMIHLKSVCEYGRTCGYSIALDDIKSVKTVQRLLAEIHPDFVKVDMQLVHNITDPSARTIIREIVDIAHSAKSTIIGEGVETDDMYQALRQLGVDLFQGYLFSPPMPVEIALKRQSN